MKRLAIIAALVLTFGCASTQPGTSDPVQLNPAQEEAALRLAGNMAGVAMQKYKPEFIPEAVAFCAAYDALKDPEQVRSLIRAGLDELAKEEDLEGVMPMLENALALALPIGVEDVPGLLAGKMALPEFDAEILAKMDFVVEGFCQVTHVL